MDRKRNSPEEGEAAKEDYLPDVRSLNVSNVWNDVELQQKLFWCQSVKQYERNVEKYRGWCAAKGLQEVDRNSVIQFLISPEMKQYKTTTCFVILSCIKKWLGVFHGLDLRKDYYIDLLMKNWIRNEVDLKKKAMTFIRDQMEKWLMSSWNQLTVYPALQRLWVFVGLYGCARLKEIERLTFESFKKHGETCVTVNLLRYLVSCESHNTLSLSILYPNPSTIL